MRNGVGTPTQLTFNAAFDTWPSISGDGSKIAFESNVDGDLEIFVINSDGTNLTKLTNNTASDGVPSISGDGGKIAFKSNVESGLEIYVINSDGTGLTQLTFNNASDWFPSISGDGSKIAFQSDVDGDWEIFVVSYTPSTPTIESSNISGTKKDIFQPGESVYATGSGYAASTTYDLYVVSDTTWTDGMAIPARVSGIETSITTDASGNIAAETLIWTSSVQGQYDIVVDVGGDGYYNVSTDALDDMDVSDAGFEAIPEFSTIALPVASILGLLFFFNYRKRRREH